MKWARIAWDVVVGFLLVFWAQDSPLWAVIAFGVINGLAWGLSALAHASLKDLKELAEALK